MSHSPNSSDTPECTSRESTNVDFSSPRLGEDSMYSSDTDDMVANPEAPQELIDGGLMNADTINDTVFSKQWAISVLIEFVKYVQDKELYESTELEDNFHDNLCKLWDVSVSEGVVKFLLENDFLDIFAACVDKSCSSRAIEISVGILANMAYVETVCEAIEQVPEIIKISVCLLQSSYPPILIETTRLLTTCISRSNVVHKWMDEIRESSLAYDAILFILQSSTNSTLLPNTAKFIDKVLERDDSICLKWSSPDLVNAVMEAVMQLGPQIGHAGETFLHILQCLSTTEAGVQALAVHAEKVCKFSISYLKSLCDEDFIVIDGKENTLASTLSILNAIFCLWNDRGTFVSQDYSLIRCLLKLLEVAFKGRNGSDAGLEDVPDAPNVHSKESLTNYIHKLLLSLLRDTLATLLQICLANLQSESGSTGAPKVPRSLEYLETVCGTDRLTFFFQSSSDHNLWLDVVKSFSCSRLIDFISLQLSKLKIR